MKQHKSITKTLIRRRGMVATAASATAVCVLARVIGLGTVIVSECVESGFPCGKSHGRYRIDPARRSDIGRDFKKIDRIALPAVRAMAKLCTHPGKSFGTLPADLDQRLGGRENFTDPRGRDRRRSQRALEVVCVFEG